MFLTGKSSTNTTAWFLLMSFEDWCTKSFLMLAIFLCNLVARLITYINYEMGTVTVLAVLTHKEYDKGGWKNACNC
jgi:hypothetical protein